MGRKPKPSFFKVLLGDFTKRLQIPTAFIKHINGKLPGKFKLKNRNGTCWHVKVKRIKDGWFFRRGWKRFVKHHSLKVGEFLVFSYNGKCKFTVTIFDNSACEKELPLAQTRNKNDHEGGLTKIPKVFVKQEEEELGSDDITDITDLTQKAVEPYRHNHKIMINGTYKRVSLLETDHPHLTQIWKPTLKVQITIPRTLAVETGLVDKKQIWLWDPQGRSWPVSVHLKKDGRVYMSDGWLDFCKGNNLVEGDAFVFEFLKEGTGDYTIRVHIFKAASEYL